MALLPVPSVDHDYHVKLLAATTIIRDYKVEFVFCHFSTSFGFDANLPKDF